jgi:hypothetical protein
VKLVWLLSVPVIALVALFAVRSSPTFAGPACADSCGGVVADQGMLSTYGGNYIYQQVPGQYCTDKTGGMIYVPVGAPTPSGVNCGATSAASVAAGASAVASAQAAAPTMCQLANPNGLATQTGFNCPTAAAATSTAAAASATARPSATASAGTATATGTPSH